MPKASVAPTACRNPVISMVAWESRAPNFIFVKVPNERGRYMRCDACVALVPCPYCEAVVGEPCCNINSRFHQGIPRYNSSTHYHRRNAARAQFGKNYGHRAHDVIKRRKEYKYT